MQFIDILIYILAFFGLIFTMFSIVESYNCFPSYIPNLKKESYNQIIIKIKLENECYIEDVIEKIKKGNYDNIYEIAEDVKIMKYN